MKTVTDLLNYYSQFPGETLLADLPDDEEGVSNEESKEADFSRDTNQ